MEKISEAVLIPWDEKGKETNEEYLIGEELDGDVIILPEDGIRNLLNDEKVNKKIMAVVDKYYSKICGQPINNDDKDMIVNYIKSLYEEKLEKKITTVEPYLVDLRLNMSFPDPDFQKVWEEVKSEDMKISKSLLKLAEWLAKKQSEKIEKKLDKAFKITKNKKKNRIGKSLKKIIKSMICYKEPKDNEKDKNKQHLELNKEDIKSIQSRNKITNAPNKIENIPCINSTKGKNISIELNI